MSDKVNFDIRAQNKTDQAFNKVKKNLRDTKSQLDSFSKAALGIGAAVGGVYALAKGVQAVTEAANVQEKAERKLQAVLKATGGAAEMSFNELKDYAGALQGVTTYGDEATIAAMSLLATFKEIKGDVFKATTKAALDMSTVMDQDLKSSMIQLGKALNDPVKGLTALSRVGVSFTEAQKEMIAQLVESGDIMSAQGVILQELESEFGGAAEAVRDTFGGAVVALSNAWGDLLEEIGFALTKNANMVELINRARVYIEQLIPQVGTLVGQFSAWVGPVEHLGAKLEVFKETVEMMLWPLRQAIKLMNAVGTMAGRAVGGVVYGGGAMPEQTGPTDAEYGFATGTGPKGLPKTGVFYGHQGEVVLNPAESEAYRRGGSGGGINITIAPTFMSGDRNAARVVADELRRALAGNQKRLGIA